MPDPVAASLRLAPEALTRPFSAEQFSFTTTNDLEPFRGVLGQERAVEALQFGVAMPRPGYNVFVMGEPGTGRFSFVKRYLKAEGKRLQTPADWVYVNNFDEPREPRALELPSGTAGAFIGDINGLIDNLLATFPAVFEHPSYQQKKSAIDRAFKRIEEGTYGLSVESGKPIPDARLELIPWAERTAEEQARFERVA